MFQLSRLCVIKFRGLYSLSFFISFVIEMNFKWISLYLGILLNQQYLFLNNCPLINNFSMTKFENSFRTVYYSLSRFFSMTLKTTRSQRWICSRFLPNTSSFSLIVLITEDLCNDGIKPLIFTGPIIHFITSENFGLTHELLGFRAQYSRL